MRPASGSLYPITFVGNNGTDRDLQLRKVLGAYLQELGGSRQFEAIAGKRGDWQEVMRASTANLAPRGYGRSAFHIAETIQMGLIAVYVWDCVSAAPTLRMKLQMPCFSMILSR